MTCETVVLATPGAVRRCVGWLRGRRGWNQKQLAAATGRSQQWVSKLESGRIDVSLGDVLSALHTLEATIIVRDSDASAKTI